MKNRKTKLFIIVIVLLLSMTIGFAIVSTNLNISGDILVKSQTWDIYFSNVRTTEDSIDAESLNIDQNIPTQVNYTANLSYGEKFEFLVDANNKGTLTALIGTISNDLSQYANNLTYNITYLNGSDVAIDQPLYKDNLETYKVTISYSGTDNGTLIVTSNFNVTYVYGKIELATASYSLVGKVYDQNKNLLTGGQVVIDDTPYQIDETGSYTINNLTSGEHIIEIKDQDGNLIQSDTFTIQSGSENSIVDNVITSLSYLGMNANILITDTEVLFSDSDINVCPYEAGQTWEFAYTGDIQEFIAECPGTYRLEVWGGQGGGSNGGKGGYSRGSISIESEIILYIGVGGQGSSGNKNPAGGYNGGGYGRSANLTNGSGGGATHIATRTGVLSSLSSYQSNVLIVAGGGGGKGNTAAGGAGGGTSGENGANGESSNTYGGGASQSSAGVNRNGTVGGFGYGASIPSSSAHAGGGGGGGYYGGGAGKNHGSGGGGSGYIDGVTDGETIAGNLEMPTHDGTSTMTGNTGAGYAKITIVSLN